jgi:hypothetical protein
VVTYKAGGEAVADAQIAHKSGRTVHVYVHWSLAYPVRVTTVPKAINENDIDVHFLNNHTCTYMYSGRLHNMNSANNARSRTVETTSRTTKKIKNQSSKNNLPFPRALVYPRPPRSKFPYEYIRKRRPPCFRMPAHAPFTEIYMSSHIGKRFLFKAKEKKGIPTKQAKSTIAERSHLHALKRQKHIADKVHPNKKRKKCCGRVSSGASLSHPS